MRNKPARSEPLLESAPADLAIRAMPVRIITVPESLGTVIDDDSCERMLDSAAEGIRAIMAIPDGQLREQCNAVAEFARATRTRRAYSKSFSNLLNSI